MSLLDLIKEKDDASRKIIDLSSKINAYNDTIGLLNKFIVHLSMNELMEKTSILSD